MAEKSRAARITLITNHIQRAELNELEDKGMSKLLQLQDKISELRAAPTSDKRDLSLQETLLHEEQKKQQQQEKILQQIMALQLQLVTTQKQSGKNHPDHEETNSISPDF